MRRGLPYAALIALALPLGGCGAWDPEPETPATAAPREHGYGWARRAPDQVSAEQAYVAVPQPVVEDNFWRIASPTYDRPPPPRPRSISLGYIGDEPLGWVPGGTSGEGPWWRPFPPSWERSFHSPAYGYGRRYGRYR